MTVLVDTPAWPAHGRLWAHVVSDHSLAELHAFAGGVGLPRRSFEGDHYDVPAERWADVVAAGARHVPGRELVRALQRSGLRLPKRRGERVLRTWAAADVPAELVASGLPTWSGDAAGAVDCVVSPLAAPTAERTVALLVTGRRVRLAPGGGLPLAQEGEPLGFLRRRGPSGWRHVAAVRPAGEVAGADVPADGLVPAPAVRLWLPLLHHLALGSRSGR